MTTSPTEIIIDLDRRSENERNPNEAIQTDAIARFARLLAKAVDNARASKKPSHDETEASLTALNRLDNVIVLNGGRGSGKSTLLYSLLSAMDSGEKSLFKSDETKIDFNEIKVLGVIDPSLIETKENIFVTVLTLLKKAVEKALDGKKSDDLAAWKQSLTRLAGGLSRLDQIGKDKPHEDWDDALYIMEQGLEKTRSSVTFNQDFRDFLSNSLKLLNKSLFVIAFDDIDTASHKGWEVLEVIRKYLAVPTILVVLSGDLDLYSTIVRQQQWKNFGEELWSRERNRRNTFRQQVNDLEDQYLLKVLSLKNRIDLLRLGQIMSGSSEVSIRFKSASADKKLVDMPLVEFLNEHIKHYFCVSERDIHLYRDFILRQPVRSIVQILEALKNNPYTTFKDKPQPVSEGSRAFAALALGALTRHEIRSDTLLLEDDQAVLVILREMLNQFDLWDAGYRLRPDLRSDDDNLVTLAFSSRLTAAVNQKPDLFFDYFIKVCLPHEAYRYVPTMLARLAGVAESKIAMSQYLAFVSRNLREDSLTEARQNVAVTVKYKGRSFSTSGGVVAVFGARSPGTDNIKLLLKDANDDNALAEFWSKIKKAGFLAPSASTPISGTTHNTWKQFHQRLIANTDAPATGMMKHFASLFASQVVASSGTTSTYLSIMNLLGALSHLMKVEIPDKPMLPTSPNESELAEVAVIEIPTLVQEVRRTAGIRSHPVPNWNTQAVDSSGSEEDEEDTEDGDETEGDTTEQERFLAALARWKHEFARTIEIRPASVYFLARVWSRFYYTIVAMDTEIKSKDKYLGWIVHRYIVAFLSAALIEEAIEHNIGTNKLNLNNPVTEDGIFLSNLGKALGADEPLNAHEKADISNVPDATRQDEETKRLKEIKSLCDGFPFFASLFACPLWAAFLHPRIELPKKYGSGRKLLDIQISLWSNWVPISTSPTAVTTKKLVAVGYNPPPSSPPPPFAYVLFDNLFDPLNSVLVQARK